MSPNQEIREFMAKVTHIAVISIPAFSHQASIVEFCKRLVHLHHHIHVTCIFPTIGSPPPATVTLLESLPSTVDYNFLPPVNEDDLPQGVVPAVQIQLAVSHSIPCFRDALGSLHSSTPLVALVADPFAGEALEVAKEFNISSFIYFPPSAMTLSLLLHVPTIHDEISCEYRDHGNAIQIPGCIPIYGHDLPEHFCDRSSIAYELILRCSKRLLSLADGFLVNSFSEIEEGTVRAIQEHYRRGKTSTPVYLVGPIIQTGPSSESSAPECVGWLENQRANSVLYVSFGSGGTLSQEQLNEMALGLELSGQKFLWVFRAPSNSANRAYLGAENEDPLKFLPHGFLERTKGQGLVVPNWAPQTQILSHPSTGGFLTHCGWNSALESIVMGVPMIAWPLFAEQRMNAVLLTEGLKVALRPKFNENGIAEGAEIAKVIKLLMLGEERNGIQQRTGELKDAAADALNEDGSSTRALSQFVNRMETPKHPLQ